MIICEDRRESEDKDNEDNRDDGKWKLFSEWKLFKALLSFPQYSLFLELHKRWKSFLYFFAIHLENSIFGQFCFLYYPPFTKKCSCRHHHRLLLSFFLLLFLPASFLTPSRVKKIKFFFSHKFSFNCFWNQEENFRFML